MNRIIINFLAVVSLGLLQQSFLVTWPWPISGVQLILVLVIFLIVLGNYRQALWWAFGGGALLELFSFELFGSQLVSLLVTVFVVNLLFTNFFTNYSFYSLTVLGIIGTIFYNLILTLLRLAATALNLIPVSEQLINGTFFLSLGWQIFVHLVILYILFFTFHFLIGRLRLNVPGTDAFSIDRRAGF